MRGTRLCRVHLPLLNQYHPNDFHQLGASYNDPVKLIGNVKITTSEFPDHLQIVVTREFGLLMLILPPATMVALIGIGILGHFWILALMGVFGLGSFALWYRHGPVTTLNVSASELTARGNIDRSFRTEIVVPASEVKSLGYEIGDEQEPSGLYVRRSWRNTCLLPDLNRKDTMAIADAVHDKFPGFERQDDIGVSFHLS